MKSYKITLLAVLIIIVYSKLQAQNEEIISYEWDTTNHLDIFKYNLTTEQNDTFAELDTNYTTNPGTGASIDPYNARYFFSTTYDSNFTSIGMADLNSQTVSIIVRGLLVGGYHGVVPPDSGFYCDGLFYDQFYNAVIYRSYDNRIRICYLDSNMNSGVLLDVLNGNYDGCIEAFVSAYDYLDGLLFLESSYTDSVIFDSSAIHWTVYNIVNKTVLSDRIVNDSMVLTNIIFSPITLKYYGLKFLGGTTQGIYEVNPQTGQEMWKCGIPNDYSYGGINGMQSAMYDPVENDYLLPYVSTNNTSKLARINLSNDSIVQVSPFYYNSVLNQLLYTPSSSNLVLRKSKLYATKGLGYLWYLNDSLIGSNDTNYFTPVQPGYYRVGVQTGQEGIIYSDSIYVNVTSITEINEPTFEVFPNPTSSQFSIKSEISLSKVQLFSLSGTLEKEFALANKEVTVNTDGLSKGAYILECTDIQGRKQNKLIVLQ